MFVVCPIVERPEIWQERKLPVDEFYNFSKFVSEFFTKNSEEVGNWEVRLFEFG